MRVFWERFLLKLFHVKQFRRESFIEKGRYTIFEFDFGMDLDENCSYRDRRSLEKVTIEEMSRANEERKFVYCLFVYFHKVEFAKITNILHD